MLEETVEEWVLQNFALLGFEKLVRPVRSKYRTKQGNKSEFGDCRGFKNGKWLRVEIETTTSGYFIHSQKVRNYIDVIVCVLYSTPKLQWKKEELKRKEIIELWKFKDFRDFCYSQEWRGK